MSLRYTAPYFLWVDGDGIPAAGWLLYFYASGTSTPLATYSDVGLTTPNTNPVEANADGYWGPIYLQSLSYKVVLKTADDVQVWSADPVSGAGSSSENTNVRVLTTTAVITADDGTLICNSSIPFTATLPTASTVTGRTFTFVQINTGAVTIIGTIDGVSNYILPSAFPYQSVSVRSIGASYVLV